MSSLVDIPRTYNTRYIGNFISFVVDCKQVNSIVYGSSSGSGTYIIYLLKKDGTRGSVSANMGQAATISNEYDWACTSSNGNATQFYFYFPT